MFKVGLCLSILFHLQAFAADTVLEKTKSAANTTVYIVAPKNNQTVTSPFTVVFGLIGMGVAPAGVNSANTGHHHLLIDTELTDFSKPIPADDKHIHFGGGQTETKLNLKPGPHTLQLVLADHLHIPHEPPIVSKKIKVIVK